MVHILFHFSITSPAGRSEPKSSHLRAADNWSTTPPTRRAEPGNPSDASGLVDFVQRLVLEHAGDMEAVFVSFFFSKEEEKFVIKNA